MRVYLSSTTSAWCRRPVSIRGPSGHEPDALPLSYVGLVPSTRVERATTAASRPRLFHWATRACSRQGPFRFAGADGCNPLTRPAVAPRPGFEPSSPHPECGVLPNRRPGNGGRRAADSPAGDQRCTSWATGAGLRRLRHHPLGGSRVPDLLLRRRLSPLVKYGSGSRNRTCVCTEIQSPVALASRAPRNGGAVGGHRPRFFGLEDRRVRQVHHDRMAFHLRRPYGARTRNLLAENQVSCQLAPTAHGTGGNRGREPTIAVNVPSPGALGGLHFRAPPVTPGGHGCVEKKGFEPSTSGLPNRRSPS